MNKTTILAILLVAIGLGSLAAGLAYTAYVASSYAAWSWQEQNPQATGPSYPPTQTRSRPTITIEQAKTIAQQYLASMNNPNLEIKEMMESEYNFYVLYYEKDTGIGAFEMLIWKQTPPSGMMGNGMMNGAMMGMMGGYIMPEPGPNMMWNTKYSPMAGMMRQGMMGSRNQASSEMTITKEQALHIAQSYVNSNFKGAEVEDATQFYGYYTIDYEIEGRVAGMLSVNGQTGNVWYHSWHGAFIAETEFD